MEIDIVKCQLVCVKEGQGIFAQMIFVVLLLLSLPDQVISQSQYKAENSKNYLEEILHQHIGIAL